MRIDGYPFPAAVQAPRTMPPPASRAARDSAGTAATENAALSPQEKLRLLLDEKRGVTGLDGDPAAAITLGRHIDLRV